MSDRVVYTIDNGVADVRLNRPEKMNALDSEMFQALGAVGAELAARKDVRAIVLSGEGRSFCAGLDFGNFQAMGSGEKLVGESSAKNDDPSRIPGMITHFGQQAVWVWREMEIPVIAAIHGAALGGGCQIALGADIRFVSRDAKLSVLEIRWGLIPDMTGTYTLPQLVGLEMAKELTWTGRMVGGEEAVKIGLASHLSDDPRADALALAREIATKSPDAIRAGKKILNMVGISSIAEQFKAERVNMGALIGSPNNVEAVKAYFEKRDAVYADPR